jgi:Tfp pilus assembly protein PilO
MNRYIPDSKIFRASMLFALLSIACMVLVAWLVYSRISLLHSEIAKTQAMSGSVEQAFKIKGQLNELEEEIDTLDSFFIKKNEEVVFIESIEKLASSTGVALEIKNISVDPKSSSKDFKEDISVNVEAEGARSNLITFFKKLENMPKAVSLERFDIRSADEKWSLDLTLTVPRLK